ncbi:hypothetical protein ACIQNU_04855 [Streptomyces sp. NPDC091292]|uniref:hypothetical protein n=1 Tax=Streptomyces sp. NPDC091292 TaxID=3365991 RepID=UPI0038288C19
MSDTRDICEPAGGGAPPPWPTPDAAYRLAPSIHSEIGWTTHTAATAECYTELDREYYLRKAVLLDRIALLDDPAPAAIEAAVAAALYLLDTDRPGLDPDAVTRAGNDPRGYVRDQYTAWTRRDHIPPPTGGDDDPGAALWDVVAGIVAALDEANGRCPHENAARLLKVTEEAGEAAAAYIGAVGQNPRKGFTHGPDQVADELADVIIAAAVAMHSFDPDPASTLAAKLHQAAARLNASAPAHL